MLAGRQCVKRSNRTLAKLRRKSVKRDGSSRAEALDRDIRDADLNSNAFLVRLGFSDRHDEATLVEAQIFDIQRGDFGASAGDRESQQYDCPVSRRFEPVTPPQGRARRGMLRGFVAR